MLTPPLASVTFLDLGIAETGINNDFSARLSLVGAALIVGESDSVGIIRGLEIASFEGKVEGEVDG